jgi:hypothetical protein
MVSTPDSLLALDLANRETVTTNNGVRIRDSSQTSMVPTDSNLNGRHKNAEGHSLCNWQLPNRSSFSRSGIEFNEAQIPLQVIRKMTNIQPFYLMAAFQGA